MKCKLTNSRKLFIIAIVMVIVTLTLDILFTNLLVGKIYNINNKIKQLNISSQEREKELNLRDSIVQTQADREELQSYFVGTNNAEIVIFTQSLENLARQFNVVQKKSLTTEKVSDLGPSEYISSLRYRVNVVGKWSDVFGFLQAVENLPKILYMNSASLSFGANNVSIKDIKKGSDVWSADLDFSIAQSEW